MPSGDETRTRFVVVFEGNPRTVSAAKALLDAALPIDMQVLSITTVTNTEDAEFPDVQTVVFRDGEPITSDGNRIP